MKRTMQTGSQVRTCQSVNLSTLEKQDKLLSLIIPKVSPDFMAISLADISKSCPGLRPR